MNAGDKRNVTDAFQTNAIQNLTRRQLFQNASFGIGGLALSWLLSQDAKASADSPTATKNPSFPHARQRAKNIIYLHMVGAPSHLDLFDYKPELQKRNGEKCPDEFFKGKRLAFIRSHPTLLGTRIGFKRCGKSGLQLSNALPHLGEVADDIALIKTMRTDHFNHAPAQMFLQTGFERFGRPSLGAWVDYGLGSENADLPGFVVMNTGSILGAGNSAWGPGFLPSVHQGVEFRNQGDPVLFLSNPKGIDSDDRRRFVDTVTQLNRAQLADVGDPEIATRIRQYEMAYRMQKAVPELMDIASEPKAMHELYGTKPGKASFANHCLLARRLVERGVRFVQLFDQGWDHHGSVFSGIPRKAAQVDRPIAALIKDLKARGLLDETLIVWSSEFGRTPMAQGANAAGQKTNAGRDHHKEAYTVWMAGAGVRGGTTYGATDELGYAPIDKPMHVHDFNATILHLLGLDHEKLTFKHQGRKFRLTDVAGEVAHDLFS